MGSALDDRRHLVGDRHDSRHRILRLRVQNFCRESRRQRLRQPQLRRLTAFEQPPYTALDAWPCRPYLAYMGLKVRLNLRALLATMFVLCLATAPVCAARCSVQVCAVPGASSSVNCHEVEDQGDSMGWKPLAHGTCAPNELVFTTGRLNERLTSDGTSSISFALVAIPRSAPRIVAKTHEIVPLIAGCDPRPVSPTIPLRL